MRLKLSFPSQLSLCCLFFIVSSCEFLKISGEKSKNKQEIVLGYVDTFSGPRADFGRSIRNGIFLALDDYNRVQKDIQRQVRLVTKDDEGEVENTKKLTKLIIEKQRPLGFFAASASSRALEMAMLSQQEGIPIIAASATHPSVTEVGSSVFRVCFIDEFQGLAMAQYARETLGADRAALLFDSESDYSRDLAETFGKHFLDLGGKQLIKESYRESNADFAQQLAHIKKISPEVIYIPGFYADVIRIAKEIKRLKISGLLLGADGWDSTQLKADSGGALEKGVFTSHFSADNPDQGYQSFKKKYVQKYARTPNAFAALGFDAASVMIGAIEEMQPPFTAEKLRNKIRLLTRLAGVTGDIVFNEKRNPIKPVVLLEIRSGEPHFLGMIRPDPNK